MRLFRRRPRSPALVLLLLRPLLASSGASAPGPQPRAMNAGGSGARGCCPRLQRSTVPGSDPQRCNELLLLTAGDGAAQESRHHVLYFPGDVQVTRAGPPRHAHAGCHTGGGRGWGRDLGGRGLSVGPGAAVVGKGEALQGVEHGRTAPAFSGTTVCVLGTGHCLQNAVSLKYSR